MNVFTCSGNLGRSAEQRFTPSGKAVLGFALAVKHGYGDNAGTVWLDCSLWGKRAEGQLVNYLTKGAQVCVSGEISLEEYKGKDGTLKTKLRLNVQGLDLVGGKPDTGNDPQSNHQTDKSNGCQKQQEQPPIIDDDLPF